MSGTELAYNDNSLCGALCTAWLRGYSAVAYSAMSCHAMSGIDTQLCVRYWHTVCCYALSGTGIQYAAMLCLVLTYGMMLRGVRY
eukprot:1436626-Rhodomonas_salina.1